MPLHTGYESNLVVGEDINRKESAEFYLRIQLQPLSHHQVKATDSSPMLFLLLLLAAGLNQAAAVNPKGHYKKQGKCQVSIS